MGNKIKIKNEIKIIKLYKNKNKIKIKSNQIKSSTLLGISCTGKETEVGHTDTPLLQAHAKVRATLHKHTWAGPSSCSLPRHSSAKAGETGLNLDSPHSPRSLWVLVRTGTEIS